MIRIAIPVKKGKLSEFFALCNHYEIFEIDKKLITSKTTEVISFKDITKLPAWIAKKEITDVITFKIDIQLINLFIKQKVNLYVGIKIQSPQKIIEKYLNGRLISDKSIISEIIKKNNKLEQ